MITTTLNRIREHYPCKEGWEKLLQHLGKTQADDEPLPYSVIVESNGLEDALWCCRVEPQYAKEWRLFAVWCARQVQHLMNDARSVETIDVAERFANGKASHEELDDARAAAIPDAEWDAARTAARTAAWATARSAEWAAAEDAADAAEVAVEIAAEDAAWDAAAGEWVAAGAAARAAQTKRFLEVVGVEDEQSEGRDE